jgi:GLPGLI family protein
MNKIHTILIIVSVLQCTFCQSYSKVDYKISRDSTFMEELKISSIGNDLHSKVYKSFIEDKEAIFSLVFNSNYSSFENTLNTRTEYGANYFSYGLYSIYGDLKQKIFLRDALGMSILYAAKDKSWKIIDTNKKKIGKYNCIMATIKVGKVEKVAWFTPDIPISTGPGIYFGLPGLVLEVSLLGKYTIYASKISLNDKNIKSMPPMPKGEQVTEEQFMKKMEGLTIKPKKN